MPKNTDKSGYSSRQIEQLLDLIISINKHSIAMSEPPHTIYFTLADIQRELSITRYHAKKLAAQCVRAGIFYQEKLRYRLSSESSLYVVLRQTARLSEGARDGS